MSLPTICDTCRAKQPAALTTIFGRHIAFFGDDFPFAGGQQLDIDDPIVPLDLCAHVGRAAGHRVGQTGRVGMAVARRVSAGNHAVEIDPGDDAFDFVGADDLHVEADALRHAAQVLEPVEVIFVRASRMPPDACQLTYWPVSSSRRGYRALLYA